MSILCLCWIHPLDLVDMVDEQLGEIEIHDEVNGRENEFEKIDIVGDQINKNTTKSVKGEWGGFQSGKVNLSQRAGIACASTNVRRHQGELVS